MESLAKLLAISMGHDPHSPEFGVDEMEARIILNGLVRVLRNEDLATEIAKRLYEHQRERLWPNGENTWEDITLAERNNMILKAMNVLDALNDLIIEDLYPGGG